MISNNESTKSIVHEKHEQDMLLFVSFVDSLLCLRIRFLMGCSFAGLILNAIKLTRHSGMDRRNPDCRDANNLCHPWSLGSGDPCRNDELFLNLIAARCRVASDAIEKLSFMSGIGA